MEIIAEGLAFPEGPVVMADGSIIVVETMGGRITRCWDGKKETVSEPGGGPNGAAIGPDGALWVCNNGGGMNPDWDTQPGWIERIDLSTGKAERVYESCDGRALQGPNDLVFDADGRLWFTDLGAHDADARTIGGFFTCLPDGSEITAIYRNSISYNGVGLSPDGKHLWVADTWQARLYRYDRRVEPQEPRYVATASGAIGFDSLGVAASGNICVAVVFEGGIATITPDGHIDMKRISGEQHVTNIAFGGEDMRDAYLTLSGSGRLAKMRWDEPGLKLEFNG